MLSDREILDLARRAGRGERRALERLVGALRPLVCRWALVMTGDPDDAEDVAQLVLMKTVNSIASFDGRAKVTSWVYRITRNARPRLPANEAAGARLRREGRSGWPSPDAACLGGSAGRESR